MTLKLTIEESIYKLAPDLDRLEVEGLTDTKRQPVRIGTPVTFVPPRRQKDSSKERDGGWKVVEGLQSLSTGSLKAVTIAKESLLFCQIDGTYYAYYNRCSSCQMPLENSRLEGTMLSCSACGQQYDIYHAGKSLDASNLFLNPVPLLIEGGKVKVSISALTEDTGTLSAPAR